MRIIFSESHCSLITKTLVMQIYSYLVHYNGIHHEYSKGDECAMWLERSLFSD